MALFQKLLIRQSQALVMTPQLMQAIKLLQLSHLDLAAYVDTELEKNPLLERPAEEEPVRGEPEPADEAPRNAEEPRNGDWMEDRLETSRDTIEQRLDTGLENVFPDEGPAGPARQAQSEPPAYSEWAGVGPGGRADGDYNLEAFVTEEASLAGHLAEQVALAFADPVDLMIAQYLVDLVDEAGYLTGDLAEARDKLGAPLARIEAVLAQLQALDPPGVCARNLTECLAIQLRELDRLDPAMAALLDHLDLLAKRDFAALRKICGVDEEDLAGDDRGDQAPQSQAGIGLRVRRGAADRARRVRAPGRRRRLAGRAQPRHAAAGAGQPVLLRQGVEDRQEGQ